MKKIFIALLLFGIFLTQAAYADEISLSLQITAPPLIDEEPEEEEDDDDRLVVSTVTGGGGGNKIIIKKKKPAEDNPDDVSQPDPIPTEEKPDFPKEASKPDELVEDVDKTSGIKITYPAEGKDDYGIEVPAPPTIDLQDIVIPKVEIAQPPFKHGIDNQFVALQGKLEQPNLYLLLEINSDNHLVVLQTDENGFWSYEPSYPLLPGEHHVFLWSFFSAESSLLTSLTLDVTGKVSDSTNRSQVVLKNVLQAALKYSILSPLVQGKQAEKKLFYINGRLFNKDNIVYPDDKLEFVLVITPILNTFLDKESLLEFEYEIYDDSGKIVQKFTEKKEHFFEENLLAFTKSFSLIEKDKLVPGFYTLIVKAKTQELTYEFPLNFNVKLERDVPASFAKTMDDIFVKIVILGAMIFLSIYFYKKRFRHV